MDSLCLSRTGYRVHSFKQISDQIDNYQLMKTNFKFSFLYFACTLHCKYTINTAYFVLSLRFSNEISACLKGGVTWGATLFIQESMYKILLSEEQSKKHVTNIINAVIKIICGCKLWNINFKIRSMRGTCKLILPFLKVF